MFLSVLQVTSPGGRLRERVWARYRQLEAQTARATREVALALWRGRQEIGHVAYVCEGPLDAQTARGRLDAIVALEAGRTATLVHPEDGLCVMTLLVVTNAPFISDGVSDPAQLEAVLKRLSEVTDDVVSAFTLLAAPVEASQAFDPGGLAMAFPHLRAIDASGMSGTVRCRYCDAPFTFGNTRCPSCGGDVNR